jgi:phospholipid/cholesterol/gamma-HCH transport system substrate-binding protein
VDSTASIVTSGVLGDRYVSLQLGGESETLKSGDVIDFTESAVILERVIGKLVHNVGGGGGDDDKDDTKGEDTKGEEKKGGAE